MRLFGYYALHSFVNQVRKLLKTWVLIFLAVCIVVGGGIGLLAAILEEKSEETAPDTGIVEEQEEPGLAERLGVTVPELVELGTGGLALVMLLFMLFMQEKGGSSNFLPGDAGLLFPSPMPPQSVLMFRTGIGMGSMLILSLYVLAVWSGNFADMGLGLWRALALGMTWLLVMEFALLMQVLLYTVSSVSPWLKKNLSRCIYALLLLMAAAYILTQRRTGAGYLRAAILCFNAPGTRLIPFWGWIKGFCGCAMAEETAGALAYLAVTLAGSAALVWAIWRIKVDFYEDALARTEQYAARLEAVRSAKGNMSLLKRKKDRSEKLRREGLGHGWGANVFFFKTLHNRFRFAHFHVLTKTLELYLAAGVAVGLICRLAVKTDSILPAALTMSGLAFFRALGNPVEQDTKLDFFSMIPESSWAKLFWSLLGGAADCLLDVIPGLLAAALIGGADLLTALAWLPFVVSVDFYAANVGAFIGLSVPVSAGTNLKQIVQIMFIYFGLLPDAAILAIGIVGEKVALAGLAAAVVNLFLGFLFFGLCPMFLAPRKSICRRTVAPFTGDLRQARGCFSRIGLGIGLSYLLGVGISVGIRLLLDRLWPAWSEKTWLETAVSILPLYAGMALTLPWLVGKLPKTSPEPQRLKAGTLAALLPMGLCLMYGGALVGTALNALLNWAAGISSAEKVTGLVLGNRLWVNLVFVVLLAPAVEEFVFRHLLIDRFLPYGEKLAVVLSAAAFGLYHGNLTQGVYAFALGLLLGYVYLRTGRLRYTVGLHMVINALSSLVLPLLLGGLDLETLATLESVEDLAMYIPQIELLLGYFGLLIALALSGVVLLCIFGREVHFEATELELTGRLRRRTVFCNVGMPLLAAVFLASIVYSCIP